MRFSFLHIVAALTASMSVSACVHFESFCIHDDECCPGLYCGSSPHVILHHCLKLTA
ncbi:hypothetical protein K503DRAFT_770556 [Rhizopogon vinicolor AM-OR11-026]|uniref:Uncharacterized protein n=1 Tax=Rhizopogon vinicolor AM-OR11-026 TaxID=1314800 RepID=A0A1B7N0H6_9AGAM|nr:hypothetical protein K503DRAFT_770556 [Rhizopogon vinicolor AM-OR11-026]